MQGYFELSSLYKCNRKSDWNHLAGDCKILFKSWCKMSSDIEILASYLETITQDIEVHTYNFKNIIRGEKLITFVGRKTS